MKSPNRATRYQIITLAEDAKKLLSELQEALPDSGARGHALLGLAQVRLDQIHEEAARIEECGQPGQDSTMRPDEEDKGSSSKSRMAGDFHPWKGI